MHYSHGQTLKPVAQTINILTIILTIVSDALARVINYGPRVDAPNCGITN